MTEIERLKQNIKTEQACFHAAIEIADYEEAYLIAERMQFMVRQILLCKKQAIEEAK